MQMPHPRKIFSAIKIVSGLILLALGFSGVFYPSIIPAAVASLVPSEIFSIRHDILVLATAFVSMILGFFLLLKK